MTEIHLGFKAFDIHELLCHAVADAAGLYREAGLSVRLLDTTFLPDEALPERTFHVACGAALAAFLGGAARRVVFVACERPMFWLYGRPGVNDLQQLAHGRVATFPETAPPARFLNVILAEAQVAPGLLPCRDDVSRLALVSSGSVDAALLSSCYLPAEVARRGCRELAFVGDVLRLPSTGLAVSQELFDEEAPLVANVTGVFQKAMELAFADEALLRRVLAECFGHPREALDGAVALVRDACNPMGYSTGDALQNAVDDMASGMGVPSRPADELYDFQFLTSHD